MNKQEIEKKQLAYMNLLITGWLMLGQLDELKDTNAYKQKIKSLVNQLVPEIERMVDEDLNYLWGKADDQALYQVQEKCRLFIHQMASMKTENIAGLGELLEQFSRHPELTLHRSGIKIITASTKMIEEAAANQ